MRLTDEHKAKMAEGRARRAEAIARGDIPSPSLRARQEHARKVAREPAAREILTTSPEFKAALEDALAEKLPAMLAAIAQANGAAASESPENFAKALALQMAKFTGQGTGKTYVDPEELEKRSAGRREMMRLLKEFQESGEVPSYRVTRQIQLNVAPFGPIVIEPLWRGADRVQHDTEIDFAWIPNLGMAPLNEPARRIYRQFEIWIAAEMPEVSDAETLDSPVASMAPQFGPQVLNPHTNTIVRGAAAAAIIRNDPALRGMGGQQAEGPTSPHQAAFIRRGDDPAVRKKQVLGTLTDPIEMR